MDRVIKIVKLVGVIDVVIVWYISMRNVIVILVCFLFAQGVGAQRLSFEYVSKPLSEVLVEIAKMSSEYRLNFIYDELEDFPVTCRMRDVDVLEAVRGVTRLYPVKISMEGKDIFVECVEKGFVKLKGKVIGENGKGVAWVNIAVFEGRTNEKLCSGVSNESGDFSIGCEEMDVKVRMSCVGYKPLVKRCMAGDMGTVRLETDVVRLKNVDVVSECGKSHRKLNDKYRKRANRIRQQIWDRDDPDFRRREVADSLRKYPVVMIAEGFEGQVRSRRIWNPLRYLFGLFTSGGRRVNESVMLKRRRVLVNDRSGMGMENLKLGMMGEMEEMRVTGMKIEKVDGRVCEIDTDGYMEGLGEEIEIINNKQGGEMAELEPGDIIDYFIWTEWKSIDKHPIPFFIQPCQDIPVLSSKIDLKIGKGLYTQYRHKGKAPLLTEGKDKDGNTCLSYVLERIEPCDSDVTSTYIVYVRDPELKANSPLNAFKERIGVDPPLKDILDTKSQLYEKIRTNEKTGIWAK